MESNTLKGVDRNELKSLMREVLQELLWEMEQNIPDPDEGLELKPEIAAYLLARLSDPKRRGKSHQEVLSDLGFDD
jgi:hypothetical protein